MAIVAANALAPRPALQGVRAAVGEHLPFVFLDPRATRLYPDWERVARSGVGALRVEAAKNPYDRDLSG